MSDTELAGRVREYLMSMDLLLLRVKEFRDPHRDDLPVYFRRLAEAQISVDTNRQILRQLVFPNPNKRES